MGFETKKDKHPSWEEFADLKYPYGIWNRRQADSPKNPSNLKYPYGIWNHVQDSTSRGVLWFEVSLWDLKQITQCKIVISPRIWSIPMGFETQQKNSNIWATQIWSIPMGFETTIKH